MSETPRFRYHRPFTFCATTTPSSEFDYFAFTPDPLKDPVGQPGREEAISFWWNIEGVQFNPIGEVYSLSTGNLTFEHSYIAPFPESDELVSYSLSGSIVGKLPIDPVTGISDEALAPGLRVCFGNTLVAGSSWLYEKAPGPLNCESGTITFQIAFVGGEWRLYYKLGFSLFDNFMDIKGAIRNAADPIGGFTEVNSGSVPFFGAHSLDWAAFTNTDATEVSTLSLDSASVLFFTYPPAP